MAEAVLITGGQIRQRVEQEGPVALRDLAALLHPGSEEFPAPTIALAGGQPVLRENDGWSLPISPNGIVIFIELFQEITWTGAFDIDDIILNLTGPVLFTFLITRFNFIDKIRKLFYNTFKDKKVIKYLIYIISLIIPIIFIIEVTTKVIIYI